MVRDLIADQLPEPIRRHSEAYALMATKFVWWNSVNLDDRVTLLRYHAGVVLA